MIKQRKRRYETNSDEIYEQEILVTCELNNSIKELNNEIKRLYNNLIRLDDRVNREKRDLRNQTAIIDCIKMKEKFNKIYKDLNRISETLSMVDDNGICRCKCPIDKTTSSPVEIMHVTDDDLPFELTTFNLANTGRPTAGLNEKPKQRKKIILSEYDPQIFMKNDMTYTEKHVIGKSTTDSTTTDENKFTATLMPDDVTNLKGTVTTTETNEDMSPAMSNTIINRVNFTTRYSQTVKPQIVYNETVTKSDEDIIISSENPKSSMQVTNSKEAIEMTEFNYDEKSITPEKHLDKEIILKLILGNENSLDFTTEMYNNHNNNENDNITENTLELTTYSNEIISESTTELPVVNKNEINNNVTDETFESTTPNVNFSEFSTDTHVYTTNKNTDIIEENISELTTTSNENYSELMTEMYIITNKNEMNIKTTDDILELESTNYISGLTTESSVSKKYEVNTNNVTKNSLKLTHENVSKSLETTEMPILEKRETSKTTKGTESTLKLNLTVGNVSERITITTTPVYENNDKNTITRIGASPEDEKSAIIINQSKMTNRAEETVPQQSQQPKWYPICFYPIPCSPSPNVFDHGKQNAKDTIQYSAQSLNSYKKKTPLTGATVIQNNYPILTYCPVGMACPMTDFAGQANVLHCMMRFPEMPEFPQISMNATTGKSQNITVKNNSHDGGSKNAKTARDSEEIITGIIILLY